MIFRTLVFLGSRKRSRRIEASPRSQAWDPQYSKPIESSLYDSLDFQTAEGCGNKVVDFPGVLLGCQLIEQTHLRQHLLTFIDLLSLCIYCSSELDHTS